MTQSRPDDLAAQPPDRQAQLAEAREVVRLMESNSLSARIAAARLLQTMGPELVRSLLLLARVAERREVLRRTIYGLACAAAIVFLLVVTSTIGTDFGDEWGATTLFLAVASIASAGAASVTQYMPISAALDRLGDVRVVGVVAEALEMADTRWAAEDTLARLLPKLRASDAALLNAEQRLCICRALDRGHTHFVLAALGALGQVGDEAAIPFAERVAAGRAASPHHAKMRDAAEECLAYLRAGAERERPRRRLLRPAEQPADALLRAAEPGAPASTLVRPAGASGTDAPERLLRSRARPDNDGCDDSGD